MTPVVSNNRLSGEVSLYLRQHATNPVDWYAWGEEAFERARREDRPILLSIGYSACHWCHVMERESFENEDIAALMNALFVCVKVDREERPDIDHVYMKAVQAMTGHGGWPLTVFLTPQGRPFYAGTYFPPEDRGSTPGLPKVLAGVARAYSDQRAEVMGSAQRVADFLNRSEDGTRSPTQLSRESVIAAVDGLTGIMDAEHGGFGKGAKFPGATCLTLLLDAERLASSADRAYLMRLSLDRMASGGIYDHLGGGFHRYSVDRAWRVPHFEKMLYDQALLARVYLDAWRVFDEPRYAEVVTGTLDYVLREMTNPAGGYYATQDADSEGEEGKFFAWTRAEIADVLGEEAAALFCEVYGVTAVGDFDGRNILFRAVSVDQLAERLGSEGAAAERSIARSRARLYDRRSRRVWPERDEKIVTDWNGLMISTMAAAGKQLGRPDYVGSAMRAADFLRGHLIDDGGVRHVFAGGQARVDGFLDDYAFLGRACLDLFEATGRREDFTTAQFCARELLLRFEDSARGGFFFSASSAEPLVARTRDMFDGAVPSGNSVAAELLLRMWALTGEEPYRCSGDGILRAFGGEALASPYGGAHLLCVLDRSYCGWATVVIVGSGAGRSELERAARESYHPEVAIYSVDDESASWLPAALSDKHSVEGEPTAYICRAATCSVPITDPAELAMGLRGKRA
ncbi:MAG: thioredoxin domain-containing protein [Deltaproteobacteria bacterium]|nr:thioredoxin domain-containing protein [Deltaproteobacteria bacterium]